MEIGSAVAAVKAAIEATKAAKDVNDQAQLNAAVSEIMEKLATAQSDLVGLLSEHYELIEQNRELKELLERQRRFDDYRLEKTALGGFVMRLKDECITPDRQAHAICTNCKEDGRVSVLQEYDTHYYCLSCKAIMPHTEPPDITQDWDPYGN